MTELESSNLSSASKSAGIGKQFFHRPELDLLRLLAFLLVFVHHGITLTPTLLITGVIWTRVFDVLRFASGYGLCLFFLLSSYLITEIVLREKESTGTIHMKSFYVRRVLRIWPLYFSFLLIGFLLGRIFPTLHISLHFLLQYVFLLGNFAFYHFITANPIGPLWSISVEEQFYLCWPFLAKSFGRRGLIVFSLMLIPVSILWSSWLTAYAAHPGFAIWTSSITEFECFAAGALLAVALHRKSWLIHGILRLGFLFSGLAAWTISDGVFHFKRGELLADRQQFSHIVGFQLIIIGCCLLFLSILSLPIGRWSRPFTYLGRISYGLYVFHIFGIYAAERFMKLTHLSLLAKGAMANVLILAIAFMITVTLASLSYRFFEKKFLRWKDRFSFVQTRLAD